MAPHSQDTATGTANPKAARTVDTPAEDIAAAVGIADIAVAADIAAAVDIAVAADIAVAVGIAGSLDILAGLRRGQDLPLWDSQDTRDMRDTRAAAIQSASLTQAPTRPLMRQRQECWGSLVVAHRGVAHTAVAGMVVALETCGHSSRCPSHGGRWLLWRLMGRQTLWQSCGSGSRMPPKERAKPSHQFPCFLSARSARPAILPRSG